tara:strand:+ start:195 stop:461 length:267 start_codon:yes stop_codon:yes gene_type:complete
VDSSGPGKEKKGQLYRPHPQQTTSYLIPSHILHNMGRLWAGVFIVLMCIANAEESSKLDEIALRPTALNSYNVPMKTKKLVVMFQFDA